jgi:predicted adenylyl cyclase CyaB
MIVVLPLQTGKRLCACVLKKATVVFQRFCPNGAESFVPTNLELKAHVASRTRAEDQARGAGAEECGVLRQTDTYFRVQTGRLKLRETAGSGAELVQYERREDANERWSSYRKIDVSDPDVLRTALADALGLLTVVRKERKLFLYRGARIHLDEVERLGSFIEFEVPSDGRENPVHLMQELRKIFQVDENDIEKGSYSDLLLAKSSPGES